MLAYFLAPMPLMAILITLIIANLLSPVDIIDGKPDDAPRRAAMVLAFAVPFVYLALLLLVTVQTYLTNMIRAGQFKDHMVATILSSTLISMLIACPAIGNSFFKTWLFCFSVLFGISLTMMLTWWFVKGK